MFRVAMKTKLICFALCSGKLEIFLDFSSNCVLLLSKFFGNQRSFLANKVSTLFIMFIN